ncbi:type VII secretion target [Nocardia sp. BMG111209]|uniref:type VII secretion target n=1 Tax=Nocardia sp. BMG111209 TaxID=1160137 RepID=UPI00036C97C7|nr:type VII secretion target [Nocardia sp. BMG111209]
MKITPESLREAAIGLGKLGEAVRDPNTFPPLHAGRTVDALPSSPISAALAGADTASDQAGMTLASRFAALGQLLFTTAATFQDQDEELAGKLAEFGDLNGAGN